MRKLKIGLGVFVSLVLGVFLLGKFYLLPPPGVKKLGPLPPPKEMMSEDYLEDFEVFYQTLKDYYPYFEINKKVNGIDWLGEYEENLDKVKACQSDNEFEEILSHYISRLRNGHANLLTEEVHALSLYYLYRTNTPRIAWTQELSDVFEQENVRNRYSITDQAIEEMSQQMNQITHDTKENIKFSTLADGKVGYMELLNMGKTIDSPLHRKEKKDFEKFLEKSDQYQAIILDIRGNGGGKTGFWQEFLLPQLIQEPEYCQTYSFIKDGPLLKRVHFQNGAKDFKLEDFQNFPQESQEIIKDFKKVIEGNMEVIPAAKSKSQFTGNLYLLVDEKVYSSSEALAVFAKETKSMTLIGQRTGGDGIGSDPYLFSLPNSGYVIRFPKEMGVTKSGSINELDQTKPDIEVQANKLNMPEYDRCIQKVFELEKI